MAPLWGILEKLRERYAGQVHTYQKEGGEEVKMPTGEELKMRQLLQALNLPVPMLIEVCQYDSVKTELYTTLQELDSEEDKTKAAQGETEDGQDGRSFYVR